MTDERNRAARRRVPALMKSLLRLIAATLVWVTIVGCAAAPGPTPSPDPNALVLLITDTGGFEPQESLLTRFPTFALYGDGRMVVTGPQLAIYPGPALPNLQVLQLTPAGVGAVVRAARDAGLVGPERLLRAEGVADAPATVLLVAWEGTTHRTTVEALFAMPPTGPERAALQALVTRMQDIRSWLGGEIAAQDVPYQPTALRLVVQSADPAQAPDPQLARVVEWPLSGALGEFGDEILGGVGGRCGVVEGEPLGTVLDAARAAHELTFWRSGDSTYRVVFRPLYPHEEGCLAA